MMKRILLMMIAVVALGSAAMVQTAAQTARPTPKNARYVYTEASDLTLIGKIMDTPNPYHRVDTVKYKGFNKTENFQVRCAAGLAVVFRTNSGSITLKATGDFSWRSNSTMRLASQGYDLYIKQADGSWRWAHNVGPSFSEPEAVMTLIKNMEPTMKECLLYLPIYSELTSLQIGVEEGSMLEAGEAPFRHRVAIFGSSFTHGISTSRAGMSYPDQFSRRTGIQMLSLGCSGRCRLQPYFAEVLADVEADAYVFDAFSNPDAPVIEQRLFPFIECLRAAHPGKPLIFQQTIRRESRNYDTVMEAREAAKQAMADSLMAIAVERWPDVYYIRPDATSPLHEATVDGTHPDDYGYYLWMCSIEKSLLEILKKYGVE